MQSKFVYWHAIHDLLAMLAGKIISQTAWLLLEGNWAALLRDREQLSEEIFDDRKIGRLEGGGGRAPRGAK